MGAERRGAGVATRPGLPRYALLASASQGGPAGAQQSFVLDDGVASVPAGPRPVPSRRGDLGTERIVGGCAGRTHSAQTRGQRAAGVHVAFPGRTERREDRSRIPGDGPQRPRRHLLPHIFRPGRATQVAQRGVRRGAQPPQRLGARASMFPRGPTPVVIGGVRLRRPPPPTRGRPPPAPRSGRPAARAAGVSPPAPPTRTRRWSV